MAVCETLLCLALIYTATVDLCILSGLFDVWERLSCCRPRFFLWHWAACQLSRPGARPAWHDAQPLTYRPSGLFSPTFTAKAKAEAKFTWPHTHCMPWWWPAQSINMLLSPGLDIHDIYLFLSTADLMLDRGLKKNKQHLCKLEDVILRPCQSWSYPN